MGGRVAWLGVGVKFMLGNQGLSPNLPGQSVEFFLEFRRAKLLLPLSHPRGMKWLPAGL